jgi:hypothetical protein
VFPPFPEWAKAGGRRTAPEEQGTAAYRASGGYYYDTATEAIVEGEVIAGSERYHIER